MKNACILLKRRVTVGEEEVLFALSSRGYDMEEIRTLSLLDEKKARSAAANLLTEYDNLFLLTEKIDLPVLQSILADIVQGSEKRAEYKGAGAYRLKKGLLFALSSDSSETGVSFVESVCVPILRKEYPLQAEKIILRAVGVAESRAQALLAEANRLGEGKTRVSRLRKYDEERIEIDYDATAPKMAVDGIVRLLAEGLGDTMYAMNDVSLEEQLVSLLKLRGKKISVAESFTGGGIAKRITSVSGASEVYFEGLNTYAEESKIARLGVSEYTLRIEGAVSQETAYQMALGLLNSGNCDFAIATTGLAGPKTDRSMLPVGLCFIAAGTKEKIFVYRYKFEGNRKEITEKAINYALFHAYKGLK